MLTGFKQRVEHAPTSAPFGPPGDDDDHSRPPMTSEGRRAPRRNARSCTTMGRGYIDGERLHGRDLFSLGYQASLQPAD